MSTNTSNTSSSSNPDSDSALVNQQLLPQDQYIDDDIDSSTSSTRSNWHWIQVTIVCAIKLLLSIIAGYLSWQCSAKDNIFIRIIITFFSILFSEIYILYYSIYRVYMGNKCPI